MYREVASASINKIQGHLYRLKSNVPDLSCKAQQISPLEALQREMAEDMAAVNAQILARMDSAVPLISTLARHLILAGGKRMRPLLALAAAKLMGYQGAAHIKLAVCVEFIHTATLLHDDVVDESGYRRGQETANTLWGNQSSVLVGDFLFSRSFELMVEMGSMPILAVLSAASSRIAEGEVLQLMNRCNLVGAKADYFTMIEAKTAKLFEAACEAGAFLAAADEAQVAAMRAYGRCLGLAFQIADDVLDYASDREVSGKTSGLDFTEGKITLPVLLAWEKAEGEERQFWERAFQEHQQVAGDFERARAFLKQHNALEKSKETAASFARQAEEALSSFPPSALKKMLIEIAIFSADRCA